MAAETEQRAPELAMPEPESSPRVTTSDANEPKAAAGLQPLKTKPTTPGGSRLKVETATVQEDARPSDGLHLSGDSVSPTAMKDLQFDSRFISDAWSYEAPQNMYALLTQPTNPLDPLATGLVTPYMQLQAQQHQLHLQQQQQLEQQLEHALPLQMSPIHGSGLSSLYATMAMSPQHQMMMQHSPNASGYPAAVNLGDLMISGEPTLFLASGSPTNMVKQMSPPTPHSGGVINVKDLTLNELRPHFNKPMAMVAKELGVCITLMKKICRRNGLLRWPHRRIRSLVNRITSLQVLMGNAAGAERKRFQMQIAGLREELSAVIQNPNEKSRKAQVDTKIPTDAELMAAGELKDEFPISLAQVADEMVGPTENLVESAKEVEIDVSTAKKGKKKNVAIKTEMTVEDGVEDAVVVEKKKASAGSRTKKRKSSFGLHAHQPPAIKIPRHDELPSMSRLRSQSVPERRLRGERRSRRGRDTGASGTTACGRPSTTTHRNGRRGSISSILNDIPE